MGGMNDAEAIEFRDQQRDEAICTLARMGVTVVCRRMAGALMVRQAAMPIEGRWPVGGMQ
jgi:hypothetical protein